MFLTLFSPPGPGVHRAEEGHGEDVRHEVHEQAAVHREGRGAQRVPRAGDPAGDRARVPGESLVSSSLPPQPPVLAEPRTR